jgi:hypothetical protein
VHGKGRRHVAGVEPLGPPVLHQINQGVLKVLLLLVLVELNLAPTQDRGTVGLRVRFKTKEILKESDGRENAKERFTKVHEYRKMKNPVRGKMIQRNVKIVKEAIQKKRSRMA